MCSHRWPGGVAVGIGPFTPPAIAVGGCEWCGNEDYRRHCRRCIGSVYVARGGVPRGLRDAVPSAAAEPAGNPATHVAFDRAGAETSPSEARRSPRMPLSELLDSTQLHTPAHARCTRVRRPVFIEADANSGVSETDSDSMPAHADFEHRSCGCCGEDGCAFNCQLCLRP